MRLLFISPDPGRADFDSGIWRGLSRYAEVDVFEPPRPEDTLGRWAGPAVFEDCLSRAARIDASRYDYVMGHANAFLWMSVFRLAGVDLPFAIVPNYNHVQVYDVYALCMAAHFQVPGDVLFTGSCSAKSAFERFGFDCQPHHAPGVPLGAFRRREGAAARTRERLGLGADGPVLLYTGRLQPDKSVLQLIEAHRRIRQEVPAHLVVSSHLASDSYAERCRRLGAQVGGVVFVDRPPFEHLVDLYSLADLFVLFGVSENETFGRSAVEAMGCGAVPVVPRYDGFAENISPQAGVLVRTQGDLAARACAVDDFADAVVNLLGRPNLLAQMRQQSMASAQSFDRPVCLQRFVDTLSAPRRAGLPQRRRSWSNELLPPEAARLTAALEGRALAGLVRAFVSDRKPILDETPEGLLAYRRMWFSSFFPD